MQVEVYADIACPWCRLGAHRFDRAVDAAGLAERVELIHRPYQLDPDGSEEPEPLPDAMERRFGADQAREMTNGMIQIGAGEGVEYRFDRALAVNTFTANRLLWYALREHGARPQAALFTALSAAYFVAGRNIADHAELTALAQEAGMDGARVKGFLGSDEGVAEVREQVAAARQEGITSVPTFVFGNGETLRGAVETDAIQAALHRADEAPRP